MIKPLFSKTPNIRLIQLIIAIIHLVLWLLGNEAIYIDFYVQLAPLNFLKDDPLSAILYLHGNPPGFSIFWYLTHLAGSYQYAVIHILLISLHLISYYWFHKVIEKQYDSVSYLWAVVVLFLNPLMFIYFKYPFYCTFLFTLMCAWMYQHYLQTDNGKKLVYISLIFSLACLLRSSWHLYIIICLLIPYILKANLTSIGISVLLVLVPFSFYLKNLILFGSFAASSWGSMNWANGNHLNCGSGIGTLVPFKTPIDSVYKGYISENDPLVLKYKNVPQLNNRSLHDIRIFQVNKAYKESFKSCFNPQRSVLIWAKDGMLKYLETPSSYPFLYYGDVDGKVKSGIINSQIPIKDIFDLPNIKIKGSSGGTYELYLSWYTFMFPLTLLILALSWKQFDFQDLALLAVLLFYSAVYSFIDYNESNRMRVEIEPLWYFFGFKAFTLVKAYWQKKLRKNYSEMLA